MRQRETLLTVRTVADADALDRLHSLLWQLWSDNPDIPEDVRIHVSVSASEVCTNIIEHSVGSGPVHLNIELRLTPERIRVAFTDDGDPAAVDLNSVAFPAGLADRGRGLAIAKRLLDELSYRRENDRNRWTLVHNRSA